MDDPAKDEYFGNRRSEALETITAIPSFWTAQYAIVQARLDELEACIRRLEAKLAPYADERHTQQTVPYPEPYEVWKKRALPASPQERFLFGE
ncbi:hypothetical protein GXP70_02935 [Paenibacillus lycopersici]|uniref:Uncharacterized protein n=1 Tax=Paenibacillus lycopersici TaxID=2704462 RepID=A0A6C0FPH1_9BACL|nr:hypothetical protein [Paenibacillus lycopersici]QHT59018.1 hypothetical protein GXP70_02935 [Paenibacillus lycopersici]